MYEYNRLDTVGLKQLGIAFETEEEAEAFAEIIREELEVRVGKTISEGLSEALLDEFDSITTEEESTRWLEDNCPDYRKIVQRETVKIKTELLRYRMRIDGLCDNYEMRVNSIPIEDLRLTPHGRSYNCSKRAGIDTVGELRKVSDWSQIKNLTSFCVREIKEKLEKCFELQD